jgi:hypothetical protein
MLKGITEDSMPQKQAAGPARAGQFLTEAPLSYEPLLYGVKYGPDMMLVLLLRGNRNRTKLMSYAVCPYRHL